MRTRRSAFLAAASLAVTSVAAVMGAALPARAAAAGTTTNPTKAAAGFLDRDLVASHYHYTQSFGGQFFEDEGLTIDAVLGLDAAKAGQATAARATYYLTLPRVVHDYVTFGGSSTADAPGSLAKLALLVEAQQGDPHAVGGVDLVAQLKSEECPQSSGSACGAGDAGLYKDPDTANGFQNTVTQALALVALSRLPVADHPDAAAVAYLQGLECTDGGFPVDVPSAPGPRCASGDVDATGFAVQALAAAGGVTGPGAAFLLSKQNANGGFGDVTTSGASNANSTAVAVQALVASGQGGTAVTRAQAYLRSLQLGCSAPAARRGAITFTGTDNSSTRRASTQATQALAGAALSGISSAGATSTSAALACATATPSPTPRPTPSATGSRTPAPRPTASNAPSSGSTGATTSTGVAAASGTLPNTGAVTPADVSDVALVGAAAVLAGALLLVAARRRRKHG